MGDTARQVDYQSRLKEALLALQKMRTRLEAVENARTEPIAIIGVGCRFPGGANTPEAFWGLLRDGTDAVCEIPPSRWDVTAYYDPNPEAPGKMMTRRGGFLEGVDQFDPLFFGIAPVEARSMDPQQRLLLEVTWEALERAGYAPPQLTGSRTGVFVGATFNDYLHLLDREDNGTITNPYRLTGNMMNAIAGRLSYTLGFQGPCMTLDTACSSSLVSVHLACQSLRLGESDLAVAGGVNLILSPEWMITASKNKMLSADGRCKAFDSRADGFVRSEGCGIVVLKRLSDAQANNDAILAVIRGSAVNQDGFSSGFTVPNRQAQETVIRTALNSAKVAPHEIQYIEAHGTGTSLGDPIEVRALAAVLSQGRPTDEPFLLGSVKTNIGHAESAAGVAGLIKVVLSLQNEAIPPHLHLIQPNPYIPWSDVPVKIPTSLTSWPRGEKPRLAGVSSFGASGVNAHLVVAEALVREPGDGRPENGRSAYLLPLSAKNEAALSEQVKQYQTYLTTHSAAPLANICFTAAIGRSHFSHRLAVTAGSAVEMQQKLADFLAGQEVTGIAAGQAKGKERGKIAYLFTGQGSQYVGMGKELYQNQPTFRHSLEECDALLRPHLEQPLLSVLYPPDGVSSLLDETTYTQPALFALEYALAKLWLSWGVKPDVLMGHSIGEYVAACLAGVFTLADGLQLVAERGRLMQSVPQTGRMVVAFASEEQVWETLVPYQEQVGIAAVNAPSSVTLSGEAQAVTAVVQQLTRQGIESRDLQVSHAFHSPLMESILRPFEQVVATIALSPPQLDIVSNVSGRIAGMEMTKPGYWSAHIRQPVRFAMGMATLQQQGVGVYVECGAKPTLLGMGRQSVGEGVGMWLPSLRPGRGEWQQMLESVGQLYSLGMEVDWAGMEQGFSRRRVPLPTYPFQRQRYWVKKPANNPVIHQNGATPPLGHRLHLPKMQEVRFETQLGVHSPPHMDDHRVFGTAVVPGAFHISMILSAVKEAFGTESCFLEDVFFPQALTLDEQHTAVTQIILTAEQVGSSTFQILSVSQAEQAHETAAWNLHATGKVRVTPYEIPEKIDIEAIQSRCPQLLSGDAFYATFWQAGYHLGTSFRWLEQIWQGQNEVLCRLKLPPLPDEINIYQLYPGLIDSSWQSLLSCPVLNLADMTLEGFIYIPFHVAGFHFHRQPTPNTQYWCYTRLQETGEENGVGPVGDIYLVDETGQVIASVNGIQLTRAEQKNLSGSQPDVTEWLYQLAWEEKEREERQQNTARNGRWLIFADEGGVGQALADDLHRTGYSTALVWPGEIFGKTAENQYLLNPTQPEQFRHLFENLGVDLLQGIVHLWGVDISQELTQSQLQHAQQIGCGAVLHLLQAVNECQAGHPRLWLVTRGTQTIGKDTVPVQVAQAGLWGMGRVIALEQPELWGGLVDLPATSDGVEADVNRLLPELLYPDSENQLVFRGNGRFVPRLKQYQAQPKGQIIIRETGSYLITGGLGSLGLQVAQWLVEQGARHLVLVGRRGLTEKNQQTTIQQLESQGVRVWVIPADVSQAQQVTQLLTQIKAELPPLRGIIYAAGVVEDGVLLQQDWARFERVMAAKAAGAWNLHCQTEEQPLDFFLCFSSATAVLGWAGQGNYAAANAFLDALAHHRQQLGLPGLSVNWGPWADAGMAARVGKAGQDRWTASGISFIPSDKGLQALTVLLSHPDTPQVAVLPIQWGRYRQQFPEGFEPSLVRRLTGLAERPLPAQPRLFIELQSTPLRNRQKLLADHLRGQVAQVLGLNAPEQVGLQQGFFELGMDSLMAMELRNRLQNSLNALLPATLFFKYPTVEKLGNYLIQEVLSTTLTAESEPAFTEVTDSNGAVDEFDDLSQDEIAGLLAQELAAVKAEVVTP